jgi:hypothetical protein
MRPTNSLTTKAISRLARRIPACVAVTATLSESLEQPLTPRERVVRRLHFIHCDYCRRYERQLLFMRRSLRMRAIA